MTGTITPGGSPLTVTISNPGDTAAITFSGTQGQRISLNITGVTINFSYVSIQNPDGSNLVGPTAVFASGKFIDTKTLPQTGTYTITIQPQSNATGSMTLTLYDVPSDVSGSILPNADSVGVTITTPGQNGAITFDGTASQRVSLLIQSNTINPVIVQILKPDSTSLASTGAIGPGTAFIDTKTLPIDGTYTVSVDPFGAPTGSMTLTLYNIPSDVVSDLSIGGRPVHLGVAVPGHNPSATFSGTAGQSVVATVSPGINFETVSIKNPDGTTLTSTSIGASGGSLGPVSLPTTGTYQLMIDPLVQNTGSVDVDVAINGSPSNTAAASISGTAAIGSSLTSSSGTWAGSSGSFSYQWQSCGLPAVCLDIPGATGNQYTATDDDLDGTLRTVVTTSNASGNRTAYSVPTAMVTGDRILAPKATFSYYVKNVTLPADRWNTLGCSLGLGVASGTSPRLAFVILDFGRPGFQGSTQQLITPGDQRIPYSTAESIAEQYGLGYASCAPAAGRLIIGVGTSNDDGTSRPPPNDHPYSDANVTFKAGQALQSSVKAINSYFMGQQLCVSCQVFAVGANDIELNFSKPTPARKWVLGYQNIGPWLYVDYGDAAGCPSAPPTNGSVTCNNAWRVEDVSWISWVAFAAFPLPQIYTESGYGLVLQGDQWYSLSKFTATTPGHIGRMLFFGTLAQHQACVDDPNAAGCDPALHLLNTATQAWSQLYSRIHPDSQTASPIYHTSDIRGTN